jgi:[ribosomal protein S5]-alanine N-acetyltransferase
VTSDPGSRHTADGLPTLPGARLELRQITAADAAPLRSIFGAAEVARYIGIPLLRSDEDVVQLLDDIDAGIRSRSLFQWGVALRPSGAIVGTCSLAHLDWTNQRAEIGFALDPSSWGSGLMSEALPLLIGHAFGPLGLHRLEADVDPRNDRSLRLVERLGFRREGYLRERHLVGGERQDGVFFGLLAEEWRAREQTRRTWMKRSP